jgi:hypothetical protein
VPISNAGGWDDHVARAWLLLLFCFFPPTLPGAEGIFEEFKRSPSGFGIMESLIVEHGSKVEGETHMGFIGFRGRTHVCYMDKIYQR